MNETWSIWELFLLSTQFCCGPKAVLKLILLIKKNKQNKLIEKLWAKRIQSLFSPFPNLSFSQPARAELIFTATRKNLFSLLL